MIETIADLNLPERTEELPEEEFWKKVDEAIQEKMGLSILKLSILVANSIKDKAEEIALDLPNLAPYGDYGAMIEDNDSMSEFLKKEASKPDNWKLTKIQIDAQNKPMVKFLLMCKAVDDGDVLMGLVFTNKSGEFRHAFCQVDI